MPALATYGRVTGQWATDTLQIAADIQDYWRSTSRADALATARDEIEGLQKEMAEAPSVESARAMQAAARDAAYRYPFVQYASDAHDKAKRELLAALTRERLLNSGLRLHEAVPICERREGYLPPRWRMS